ncbi:hypothetical protein TNCV_2323541 [Trichonephila clavipes]|nr:hypothetical protein TNCV_2323541 [Trichonephila clavipes]
MRGMLWGRQVAGRNYPPTNKNTLIRGLTEEWDKLPQQLLDNVVQSIGSWLHVTGSSPVPLKTRRVGKRCTLNQSRAQMSSRWCGSDPDAYAVFTFLSSEAVNNQ